MNVPIQHSDEHNLHPSKMPRLEKYWLIVLGQYSDGIRDVIIYFLFALDILVKCVSKHISICLVFVQNRLQDREGNVIIHSPV